MQIYADFLYIFNGNAYLTFWPMRVWGLKENGRK